MHDACCWFSTAGGGGRNFVFNHVDKEKSKFQIASSKATQALRFGSASIFHSSVPAPRTMRVLRFLLLLATVAHGFRHVFTRASLAVRPRGGALFQSTTPNGATEPEDPAVQELNWERIRSQIGLFRQMALPYYEESTAGRWLLGGLLGLTLLNSGVSVLFSYLGKDFWNALSSKDTAQFYEVLSRYLPALLVGAPVVTLYRYQREQLAVHWREWMTLRTLELYNRNRVYYSLERDIDNPDQRITEDVNSFTAISLQLVITVITSLIDLASFSTILWSIYPQLFGAILIYATMGTLVTAWLGRTLVGLNFSQLSKEANFRYSLVRLRDNAESIAFYGGEDLEGQETKKRFDKLVSNQRSINKAQRNLEFFVNGYRYLVQILPVAVVAPRYFAGEIGLGVISQSVGAFNHILSDLSIIVNQFERLSTFSAGLERLSTFYEAMRDVDLQRNDTTPLLTWNVTEIEQPIAMEAVPSIGDTKRILLNDLSLESSTSDVMRIEDLTLVTPDMKRTLIEGLSLKLRQGDNLLIVGNSGAGKSSLLRAIAGLWTAGSGSILRPCSDDVYFLPQRPYCTIGSLKDQLLYPSVDFDESSGKSKPMAHLLREKLTPEDLLEILEAVDLLPVAVRAGDGDPVRGLDAELDWSNILSLGEQQRLAFGRLLVNRPKLVILDEATSALDMVAEARMYTLLRNMAQKTLNGKLSAPGLTYISVGHRPSLLTYHDTRLRISGPGDHEISAIEKSIKMPGEIFNL